MSRPWAMVPLEEILRERQEVPSAEALASGGIRIVAKIGFNDGKIQLRNGSETKTGMILVRPGDLLVSGINAAKGAIAIYGEENTEPITATIHYGAYIPNKSRVDVNYLWWLLRSNTFRDLLLRYVPGGIKTELKAKRLLPIPVPLPSVEEQRRILAKIDGLAAKIEEVYHLRRENVVESNMFLYAGLREVFCSRNAQKLLGDALELHRGFDLPVQQRIPGPYPVFAANGEIGRHAESRVKGPGVCTGRSGSVGAVNYVEEDFWPLNTALYVSDFKGNNPRLIYYLLLSLSSDLKKISTHTAVPTLDRKKAHSQIKVHIPPLPEQGQIVAHLDRLADKVDALNHLQTETAGEIGALLPSILDKAFKGEL